MMLELIVLKNEYWLWYDVLLVAFNVKAVRTVMPRDASELSIKAGEILTIINENCDGDWSQAKNSKNEYGLIHASDFQKMCDDNGRLS